jgi:hypothetical protein
VTITQEGPGRSWKERGRRKGIYQRQEITVGTPKVGVVRVVRKHWKGFQRWREECWRGLEVGVGVELQHVGIPE